MAEQPLPGVPVSAGLAGTQLLVQALGDAQVDAPLWVLTQGAVAAVAGEAPSPVQAQVWGLGRVAALEHPDRWGGLIDLPPGLDERAAGWLCAVLAGCGEDQAAVRGTGIWARRLTRAPRSRPATARVPGGSVLVTGGTGAIGARTALWLAGRGVPAVVLVSRSGPAAAGVPALAAALAEAGTAVTVAACDAGSRTQLAGLISQIGVGELPLGGLPLAGVVHAAGLPEDKALDQASTAELATVVAAKAGGAAHLDELTAGLGLEMFVLCSSVAATWGSGGQPGYAAANAFLDALAARRRARGLAATSVAWGPWGGGGMTSGEGAAQLGRRGLGLMDPALAIGALAQAVDAGETEVTVADVDWARFTPPFTLRRPSPLLTGLPDVDQAAAVGEVGAASGAATALASELAGLAPDGQERMLTGLVRAETAVVLGHVSAEAVAAAKAFSDLGIDSLTALELRSRLAAATGLKLPATLVFDHPSPAVLAGYLLGELTGGAEDAGADAGVDEGVVRRALAAVPLAQLRAAGVLGVLLKLANLQERAGTPPARDRTESIRAMDTDALIRMALEEDGS
jgi:NAD(P)-dependent dehydrogenase (short-subunit alcohol dehydrogenase family)/acyl carrier protein